MKNMKICVVLSLVVMSLVCSCASTYKMSWIDGTYDDEYKEKDYWCATGRSVDESHALGAACSALEKEMNALLGNDVRTPSIDVQIATGESGVVFSPVTGDAVVYAKVLNRERVQDNTVVRIGFKRSDMEKALKKIQGDAYDDASYALKRYKNVGRNPLDRLAALQKAESRSLLADRSAKALRLFTGKNYGSVTEKIAQTMDGIVSDLKIRIDDSMVEAPFKASMVQSYGAQLKAMGFNVVDKKEDITLRLSYKQLLTEKVASAPYAYVNYTLGYSMLFDGETILSFVENDRIAALTDNDALSKAERYATMESPQKFSASFQDL